MKTVAKKAVDKAAWLTLFFTHDLWRIRARTLPWHQAWGVRVLRSVIRSGQGFVRDKCQLHASALTYYSLLSVVPMLALAFGIAKGFKLEEWLQKKLLSFKGQEEAMTKICEFAKRMLDNTSGGLIAGIGVVLLFWTVISLFGSIEQAFNMIWGAKRDRTISRKFADYISVIVLCLPLLFVANSITVAINDQVASIGIKSATVTTVGTNSATLVSVGTKPTTLALIGTKSATLAKPFITTALKYTSYAMTCVIFSFLYIFMPNTKVKFSSGVFAGVVAGTIYILVQWGYITFQVGVSKYNPIYGSFAALPAFIIWLQLIWIVVLYGAELAYAFQNADTSEFEQDCDQASYSFRRLLSLRILHLLVRQFASDRPPLSSEEIAEELDMPIRLVRQLMFELAECGVASVVQGEKTAASRYQPGRDIQTMTVVSVLSALERHGKDNIPIARSHELDELKDTMATFNDLLAASPANRLIKDI